MKILELEKDERPRERLLAMGARNLTNVELMAILLRTGSGEDNAIDLGRKLLQAADGHLRELGEMSVERMCGISGIGPGKAVSIAAAMELGKRYMEDNLSESQSVHEPEAVYNAIFPKMKGLSHEEFWVVFLNGSNKILGQEMLTLGGAKETVVDIPRIVKRCLEKNASSIILVHNHPGGNVDPSEADLEETERIRGAVNSVDIKLLDHIIIGDGMFFSMSAERSFKVRKES